MSEPTSHVHQPVLREDVLRLLMPLAGKTVVDGTLGLGGHSEALLQADDTVQVIGIDRDAEALALASQRLSVFGARFRGIHGNFREIDRLLDELDVETMDALLLDIGVSSLHLDTDERGFSFRRNGPLDMRMNRTDSESAADWLHSASESDIADVIFEFGEERYGRRIARAIVSAREAGRIETTLDLAEVVRKAVPAKYDHRRIHPATRTFQAIRMFVNDELGALQGGLHAGFERLAVDGTLAVISFHSLEDRIVKRFFREKAKSCTCPPKMPECVCGKEVEARILTSRPICASADELARNPRSRSAKLRVATKLC